MRENACLKQCELALDWTNRLGRGVWYGQACIAGTRISAHQVVRMFANGDSLDDLLRAYPSITREDVFAGLDDAASLAEEQVTPLDDLVVAS
jgi:uncharacterized protein (DUF433 family)